jgi:hypothetical protein
MLHDLVELRPHQVTMVKPCQRKKKTNDENPEEGEKEEECKK